MNPENAIYGLVICGGQSFPHGTDKSLLDYHGKPQRYYLYDLLAQLCSKAFIACNKNQAEIIPENYNVIIDSGKYERIGPMGGLLSAFEKHDNMAFLVVGCDYPFIGKADLEKILECRVNTSLATTYYNDKEQVREPLLGLYKPGCYELLLVQFKEQDYSLNHFLKKINAEKQIPSSLQTIQSIDTYEQYQRAYKIINRQKSLKFEP